MNTVLLTGWLMKPAEKAYTPAGVARLVFELNVKQSDGEIIPWHCELTGDAQIAHAEPLAGPGRPLIVQAELCGRPYLKHGVQAGWTRYLRVIAAEFPNRSGAMKADTVPVAAN